MPDSKKEAEDTRSYTPVEGVPTLYPEEESGGSSAPKPVQAPRVNLNTLPDRERIRELEYQVAQLLEATEGGRAARREIRRVHNANMVEIYKNIRNLNAAVNAKISAEMHAVAEASKPPPKPRAGPLTIFGTVAGTVGLVLGIAFSAGRYPTRDEFEKLRDQVTVDMVAGVTLQGSINVALVRIGNIELRLPKP